MPSLTNSDGEEDVALALRLSELSADEFDEQVAQFRPEGSIPGSHGCTPTKDDVALALRLSQLSSDGSDEQVTQLHSMESASASEKASSFAPPNESDEDDLEVALNLSQLPADIFDEQVNELSRRGGLSAALEGALASLFTTMSLVRVHHPYI